LFLADVLPQRVHRECALAVALEPVGGAKERDGGARARIEIRAAHRAEQALHVHVAVLLFDDAERAVPGQAFAEQDDAFGSRISELRAPPLMCNLVRDGGEGEVDALRMMIRVEE
jgi:hypothetical protein